MGRNPGIPTYLFGDDSAGQGQGPSEEPTFSSVHRLVVEAEDGRQI